MEEIQRLEYSLQPIGGRCYYSNHYECVFVKTCVCWPCTGSRSTAGLCPETRLRLAKCRQEGSRSVHGLTFPPNHQLLTSKQLNNSLVSVFCAYTALCHQILVLHLLSVWHRRVLTIVKVLDDLGQALCPPPSCQLEEKLFCSPVCPGQSQPLYCPGPGSCLPSLSSLTPPFPGGGWG